MPISVTKLHFFFPFIHLHKMSTSICVVAAKYIKFAEVFLQGLEENIFDIGKLFKKFLRIQKADRKGNKRKAKIGLYCVSGDVLSFYLQVITRNKAFQTFK